MLRASVRASASVSASALHATQLHVRVLQAHAVRRCLSTPSTASRVSRVATAFHATPMGSSHNQSLHPLLVQRFSLAQSRQFSSLTPGTPSQAPNQASSEAASTIMAPPRLASTPSPLSPAETAAAKRRIAAARRRRSKIKAQEEKLSSALEKGGERPLVSVVNLNRQIPKLPEHVVVFLKKTPQFTIRAVKFTARAMQILLTDPAAVRAWSTKTWGKVKAELHHYWLGSKLMYADMTTCTRILARLAQGNALSRRERKQLQRTVADLLRLVPFIFFVIVPFMEFLLPFALKLFPNMLPSTFKDSFQREEAMKRQLQMRVALAEFMQDTVKEIMQDTRDTEGMTEEHKATAKEVMNFIERSQRGQLLNSEETLRVASLFNDELMLDNISRPQLVAMCRYMGVQHYGNDAILRFQLRNRIRQLKKDDQDIIWEGLDSLDKEELQQACMERGMRATGLTKAGYMRQLRQWLDLSINKNVAVSLLIMSRALNITAVDNLETALATSMLSLDEEVVTEVALSAAVSTMSGKESSEMRALKLESIRHQNELIAEEEKFRVIAKKQAEEEAAAAQASVDAVTEVVQNAQGDNVAAGYVGEFEPTHSVMGEPATTTTTAATDYTSTTTAPTRSIETVISLEELAALESLASLAFTSIVEKERKAVDQMKQNKSEMDVGGLLAAGRIGAQSRERKATGLMMKKIDSMLSSIEKELDKVDQSVGDRLNILDLDRDGVLSKDELKDAVVTVLRKTSKMEDVEWIISQIDVNKDGKISLEELVNWIAKCRDVLMATGRMPLNQDAAVDGANMIDPTTGTLPLKRASSRKN